MRLVQAIHLDVKRRYKKKQCLLYFKNIIPSPKTKHLCEAMRSNAYLGSVYGSDSESFMHSDDVDAMWAEHAAAMVNRRYLSALNSVCYTSNKYYYILFKKYKHLYEAMRSNVYFESGYGSDSDTSMQSEDVEAMEADHTAAEAWCAEQRAMGPNEPEDLASLFV